MCFLNFSGIYNLFFVFFLQEKEDIVRVIQEQSTFDKLHERKLFRVLKKYDIPTDLLIDINQCKLDSILNCENSYKDSI